MTALRQLIAAALLSLTVAVVQPSAAWADDPEPTASDSASPDPEEEGTPEPAPTSTPVDPEPTEGPPPFPALEPTPSSPGTTQPDDPASPPQQSDEPDPVDNVQPSTTITPASVAGSPPNAGAVTAKATGVARQFVDEDGDVSQVWPTSDSGSPSAATVSLTVSATKNLRGRQQLDLSWTGAHPTGGRSTNPNSAGAADDEYPFVLLQCRGVDTTGSVPRGQVRLTPRTCWTQTPGERTVESTSQWPAWRSDRDAASADRSRWANSPYDPLGDQKPEGCPNKEQSAVHWLPFDSASGTSYSGTVGEDCGQSAPEVTSVDPIGIPTNTTYAATKADGTGNARFTIWSSKENASLGCSADVTCALVAVPIIGISCDEWGHGNGSGTGLPAHDGRSGTSIDVKRYNSTHAPSAARVADAVNECSGAEDRYEAGSRRGNTLPNPAVSGRLWWSASNWKNRITVPLQFAVSPDVCSIVSHDVPESFFGSVGFTEVAQSWQPTFCTTKSLFSFNHVEAPDSNARRLLNSGGAQAALTTFGQEGGYDRPTARAPVAISGFAIAFNADGKKELPATDLKLNARLLAKLLTESYSVNTDIRKGYSPPAGSAFAMHTQPFNLLVDPEFQALNPDFNPPRGNWSPFEAASALQILGADADLMQALTSYIANDPDAAEWLRGKPDPWGMEVNPRFENIALPVQNWPLLDDWPSNDPNAELLFPKASNPCYQPGTPYLPLIHNQLGAIGTVVENLQFAKSAVKTECEGDGGSGTTFKTQGRQPVGARFVVGLVPLSSALRYGLRTASLESSDDTFVAPDLDGLKAAAALLKPDTQTRGWSLDYSALSSSAGKSAYPGLMPIYADVATSDVDAEKADDLADFLCYAATDGQVSGAANGQLPAGYLPITDDDGLGDLQKQTVVAALAVREQKGAKPELGAAAADIKAACPEDAQEPTPTPSPTADSDSGSSDASVSSTAITGDTDPSSDAGDGSNSDGSAAAAKSSAAPLTRTVGQQSTLGTVGPLTVLLLLFLTAFGGVLLQTGRSVPELARALPAAARQAPHALRGWRRRRDGST